MNIKLTSLAVCLMWTLAPGCGDDKGQDDTTTTPSTPATTGTDPTASTPTEDTPTADTPADTSATDTSATDTDDPETSGTTDPTSDPEIKELCDASFVEGQKIIEAQCKCLVEAGVFPDLMSCLEGGEGGATDECTCDVYSQFPQTKSGLECIKPAQATVLTCLMSVSCMDGPDMFQACMGPYFEAISMCEEPNKEVVSQVAIQCEMQEPFMCGSGEVIPTSWTCDFSADCSDASDEMACPGSFMCVDGMGYVPDSFKCDGYPDCADASDEAGCPTFMCMNGMQIPEVFKCNGVPDCCEGDPECPDTSDEDGCPTFMCMDGGTIPLPYQCDGSPDCMDESDEVDCPAFMCGSGEEVPLGFKCDGEPDCMDGSDEADCP